MRIKLIIIFIISATITSFAQTSKRNFRQKEVGVFFGGSYYIGDLNTFKHFIYSKPAVGVFFRYSTNYRYAFRFGFNYGNIWASDSKSSNPDQLQRNANFQSNIYEINAISEFNFVDYRIGHDKHYFSMYIFAGLSGFHFDPKGNIGQGLQSLQPLRTEGQSKPYPLYQISIPFGIGFKYNLGSFIGVAIEWGPRKTFTDYLDDVSGLYPDPKINPPSGNGLAYSYRNKGGMDQIGTMRGNPRTKDWYFFYGVSINFKLHSRHRPCYGIGMNTSKY